MQHHRQPHERSSHSTIVLRGGIIFSISILVWMVWQMVLGNWGMVQEYMPFIIGLVLICGISFWDVSIDKVRLLGLAVSVYLCIKD